MNCSGNVQSSMPDAAKTLPLKRQLHDKAFYADVYFSRAFGNQSVADQQAFIVH